ncbi:MAG: EamA family transporter [Oscillospiraceae bacterium]|nr:EamA family transporter [Oscillospiraceae bacterium]
MWFWLSLLALLCWSGSDIFSKLGSKQKDKNSHWKVTFAVGLIMGIHFFITLIGGAIINSTVGIEALEATAGGKILASLFYTDFVFMDFVRYLPVAALYIFAMVVGYISLRYIELSISSPICNCSGALAFLLCLIFGIYSTQDVTPLVIAGVALITIGIVALGFIENYEDEEVKAARQEKANRKYAKSLLAFLLPVAYLFIDALGTVGDEFIFSIEGPTGDGIISDYAANSAFELTFLFVAVFAFIWIKFVKKDKIFSGNRHLYFGGACETVGQVFYMAVMFSDYSEGMVIISAYCALSVLWSRIFLKEKLSWKHYTAIACAFAGIVMLG